MRRMQKKLPLKPETSKTAMDELAVEAEVEEVVADVVMSVASTLV